MFLHAESPGEGTHDHNIFVRGDVPAGADDDRQEAAVISRSRRHTRLALFGILTAVATQAAHAQSPLFAGDFAANGSARGVNPFKPGRDDALVILAPAKRVTGEPRSFQVVSVDIPEALPVNRPIQYEVIQGGSNVILSSLSGILAVQANRQSVLLVTLQVPAAPRAGSLSLAKVRFSVAGETPIEVPIELVVARAGHVEVTALDGLRAVRTGETFSLSYRVTNLRNAVETIEIQAIAPAGWRVRQAQPTLTLAVNSVADRLLTVSIPAESNTGGASIRLIAVAQGRPIASVDSPVQVLGDVPW